MKKAKNAFLIALVSFASINAFSQSEKVMLDPSEVPDVTHVHLNNFPEGKVLPMFDGWGGLAVDINNAPAGTDFRPLLEGLENDHCQVPHWGYVVKGALEIEYEDGTKEVFREGEAFFMRPGHTGGVLEDLLLVSFSPEDGMHVLSDHLEGKVAALQAQ